MKDRNKKQGQRHLQIKSHEDQRRGISLLGTRVRVDRVPNGFKGFDTLEQYKQEVERIKSKTSSLSSNERKAVVIRYFQLLEEENKNKKS